MGTINATAIHLKAPARMDYLPYSDRRFRPAAHVITMISLFALALLIRFGHPVARQVGTFPLHDGGLFYVIIQQLLTVEAFPAFINYNALDIPFAYPPLAFYLSAGLVTLFNADITTVLFIFSGVLAALMVPAAYLLLRALLGDGALPIVAAVLFAATPNVVKMFNAGGGITRSLGAVFMLLFLWQLLGVYQTGGWRRVPLTVIFGALTVVSHPAATFVAVKSGLVFFLFWGRNRKGLVQSGGVAVSVLVASAVWWLPVVLTHGADVFVRGLQSGGQGVPVPLLLMVFPHTGETIMAYTAVVANLALLYALFKRRWFFPVWILALVAFGSRGAEAARMVPFTALIVLMGADVVAGMQRPAVPAFRLQRYGERLIVSAFVVVGVLFVVFNAWTQGADYGTAFYRLTPEQITAMDWLRENTPADAAVVPLTQGTNWAFDTVQEWLPALSQRESLITVQGMEWLPAEVYTGRIEANSALGECYTQDVACLTAWQAEHDITPDYLFVALPHTALARAIATSGDYELVYDDSVQIYQPAADSP